MNSFVLTSPVIRSTFTQISWEFSVETRVPEKMIRFEDLDCTTDKTVYPVHDER